MSTKNKIIGCRVLMPLGLALILMLTFSVASIYWQHSKYASDAVKERIGEVGLVFRKELNNDAELLSGLIDFLERDEGLQKACLAGDGEVLYNRALPILKNIHPECRVTHFYPVAGTHKRADGFGVKAGINIIMEG